MSNTTQHLDSPAPPKAERKYGGLTAQERNELRRQKLVDSALEVFGTLGLRKATIRDICMDARVPERHFSDHFASLSDAYEAAFKLVSHQALTATNEAMIKTQPETLSLAHAGTRAFFQFMKDDPRRAQILLVDASSYWRHVTIRTNPELMTHANAMQRFAKLIYPRLPDSINLEVVGSAMMGLTIQACLNWVQSGFVQPVDEVTEHLMFAWEGLDRWLKSQSTP